MVDLAMLDNNLIYLLFGLTGSVLVIILVAILIIRSLRKQNKISSRLDEFVTKDNLQEEDTSKSRQIIQREIDGSLYSRTIASWLERFVRFLGKYTPDRMLKEMEHKLTIAGNPANLNGQKLFAIRVVLLLIGIVVAFLLNSDFKNVDNISLLMGGGVLVICIIFPSSWLNSQARNRQDEIQRALPDALDMLSVCASAGLGFDQSLQKISTYWDTELGHEIKQTIQEMEMGVTRSDALRNLSNRLEVNDLSQFVAIITQAEKIGMSYADVLTSQANQLRIMRQVRAREMANKLPGKMIIPVILFIFPAMIAVILGPAIPILINLF